LVIAAGDRFLVHTNIKNYAHGKKAMPQAVHDGNLNALIDKYMHTIKSSGDAIVSEQDDTEMAERHRGRGP
jgi:hypothetical protein